MQNPSLYKEYHEKILRSYILDNNNTDFAKTNDYMIELILDEISES